MNAPTILSRSAIEASAITDLQRAGAYRPRVVHFRWQGREWVFKDFRPCFLLVRWTIGLLSAYRERHAYERLQGLPGIPEQLAAPDAYSLVIEYVSGHTLAKRNLPAADALLAQLDRLLEEMHARGVAHFDLRTKTNIRVDPDGRPWLIDFSAACVRGRIPILSALLFRIGCFADRSAANKYRMRYAPETMQPTHYKEVRRQRFWRAVLLLPALNHLRRERKKANRRTTS